MSLRGHALVLGCACALLSSVAHAADVPQLRAHVNDYAKVLPPDRAQALEDRLTEYERATGHQLALLTVQSLAGDAIEDYSMRAAERWKLGRKGADDGLILVIVPSEHKMRIEVGYGLEGVIPDAIAARIVRDVLTPAFRRNDYAGGIDAAFAVLMHEAGGGGAEPARERAPKATSPWAALPTLLPLLLFIAIAVLSRIAGGGRGRRGLWAGGLGYGAGFGAGGGFGGGGFGGGGGGGGFGGGGGGFGGGGASGSW
jgi:uncharacterized protein